MSINCDKLKGVYKAALILEDNGFKKADVAIEVFERLLNNPEALNALGLYREMPWQNWQLAIDKRVATLEADLAAAKEKADACAEMRDRLLECTKEYTDGIKMVEPKYASTKRRIKELESLIAEAEAQKKGEE